MEVREQLQSATASSARQDPSGTHKWEFGWTPDSAWKFGKRESLVLLLSVRKGMIETSNNCCAAAQLA